MKNVFVLGSINIDLVFSVDSIPRQGETIEGHGFFMAPGGKGANQAVACAKQGLSTWMLGSIGNDALSSRALTSLQEAGVFCEGINVRPDEHTGVAGIILEKSDNRIIINGGANSSQNIEQITHIIQKNATEEDILLCQLEIPMDVIERVCIIAKKLGMQVIVNAAPAKKLPPSLMQVIDVLIVNEIELKMLSEKPTTSKQEIDRAIEELLTIVPAILVTRGAEGCIYHDQQNRYEQPAYNVAVVDTTAAGDTFIGGYIAQIVKQQTIQQALQYASACAALSIQSYGAQPSIPTKQAVHEFLQKDVT
ncbi:ribokinase [Candidatus Xianfuyuplasma coldseepsis]|uniref:Ribokinase n=1 Tax=Candidatus Xianfuyuplasma coldseepsis TaxID=2782163 RepID=A0A7L7KNZ6_9MOLU|nr:ribokinase [Xianfuyuplasma coldseepsis]QMS84255.1 ribokinase [Xianfuyuplasma coldseepsis]